MSIGQDVTRIRLIMTNIVTVCVLDYFIAASHNEG
jgi:hypothetical protein